MPILGDHHGATDGREELCGVSVIKIFSINVQLVSGLG